jgi:hypothetical protein
MTISPYGQVTSADVLGAGANPAVEECVSTIVRTARFPAYIGYPATFGYPIVVE